jgi:hypothetical protein
MFHRRNLRHGQGWGVGSRSYETRKRHENHGDCGSLHGLPLSVSTHAANHHEVRLVQLCFDFYMIEAKPENLTGCGVAKGWHRDDRAASQQPKQAAHARSAKAKPLHAPLARRALLRLDSMAAPHPCSLGIPRPQFPRLCPARLPRYPFQTILR